MKTSTFVLASIAVAAGVFGGLQLDHALKNKGQGNSAVAFRESSTTGTPVAFSTDAAGAVQAAPFDFRAAAKRATASVVSVDQYRNLPLNRGMFGDEDGRTVEREVGQGSGVVLSEDGIIVTNNHVVQDGSRFVVHMSDGRTLDAKVLGADPRSDLAVLKVQAKNLTPIEMAPITSVEVGQWVLAVGNPLGFSNTVSVGVVSSLKRDLPVGEVGLTNAIQTDAAINPGNSGGALCDAQGRLIGINSAIASGNGGSVGLGFSIPVDRVKTVVQDIVKYGYAKYAGLGIVRWPDETIANPSARQQLAEEAGKDNVPQKGIIVRQATGAASQAGIKPLDIITSVDGTAVTNFFDLNKSLLTKKPGDKVSVSFWSKGETKTADVTLQDLQPERRL